MKIEQFRATIEKMVSGDDAPVVVFSAMWPFMKALEIPAKEIPQTILNVLMDLVGPGRSVLMPTFACGYKNGICNLDEEPSTTGLMTELFRKDRRTRRTLSAFFSFNILGPEAPEVISLQPQDAWGDGSLYEWMEKENVHFLMLGTHPTHNSYPHRIEWLNRGTINYRHDKIFEGILVREGKELRVRETLYVRSLKPEVINDFTVICDDLKQRGMTVEMLDGVHLAHMKAREMKEVFMDKVKKDPLALVQNRGDFER